MIVHDVPRHQDLVYDIGAHQGEDTAYYLAKGFRVVAVEANPDLCATLRKTFAEEMTGKRLTLIEAAIAEGSGTRKFYRFDMSIYGTTVPEWAETAVNMGHRYDEIDVTCVLPLDLYKDHGVPYYLKIDIEGADSFCLAGLETLRLRPRYVSLEADSYDFDRFESCMRLLGELGYTGFQLVQQQTIFLQRPPSPPREGAGVNRRFKFGSSGPFGRDLPDAWLTHDEVLRRFRPITKQQHRYGNRALGRTWLNRQILRLLFLYPGWYDVHARLGPEMP